MKVLLAEDDGNVGNLVSFKLTRSGYRVEWVRDGDRVRQAVAAVRPDLVILDIKLPGVDGVELLRELKAGAQTRDVPVMMLTAIGERSVVTHCLELGASDYLVKPFKPADLVQRVRRVLQRPAAAIPA